MHGPPGQYYQGGIVTSNIWIICGIFGAVGLFSLVWAVCNMIALFITKPDEQAARIRDKQHWTNQE